MTVTTRPDALHDVDPHRILDLDVRPDLRGGNDPFHRIMQARQALAADGILRLRTTFEPRPLYGVMGREGFAHWAEPMGEGDWRIWFYRLEGQAAAASGAGAASEVRQAPTPLPTCAAPGPQSTDMAVLDVRGMEPPEPLTATLARLESLPVGHTLIHVNQRRPHFLFPELQRRGFHFSVQEEGDEVRVFIRRLP